MTYSDVKDWNIGDKGRNGLGEVVTVIGKSGTRYLKCTPDSYGRIVYIPAHGEIEKVNQYN